MCRHPWRSHISLRMCTFQALIAKRPSCFDPRDWVIKLDLFFLMTRLQLQVSLYHAVLSGARRATIPQRRLDQQ
jgi:hypothetical protein